MVRAAAEHEKLRQAHLRRMKVLRAQLERLEEKKRLVRSDWFIQTLGGQTTT